MALVLTAAQMKAVDRAAIDKLGVPGLVLMENAGRGVVDLSLGADEARIRLEGGAEIAARLVVAADSRFSAARRHAGIGAAMLDFGSAPTDWSTTLPSLTNSKVGMDITL